jgi:hypothetical protein
MDADKRELDELRKNLEKRASAASKLRTIGSYKEVDKITLKQTITDDDEPQKPRTSWFFCWKKKSYVSPK